MKKKRNLKERVCALVLAVLMPLVSIMPNFGMVVMAEETGDPVNPVENVEAVFTVTDKSDNGALSGVTVTVSGPEGDVDAAEKKGSAGTYTVELTSGQEYTYLMKKEGYVTAEGSFTAVDGINTEVAMELAEIEVSTTALDMKVGDTAEISIYHVVDGKADEYVWDSTDTGIATVSGGKVTAVAEGNADISVAYKNKKTVIPVTVVRNDISITLTVSPDSGPDVGSVTCEAAGIPTDAAGTLTFTMDGGNEQTVNVAERKSVIYNITDLPGDHTFAVTYQGDNKYNEASATSATLNYKKKVPLEYAAGFENGSKAINYATENWNNSFNFIEEQSILGRNMSYEITVPEGVSYSAEEVVRFDDQEKKFIPVGVGHVTIKAHAEVSTEYDAAHLEMELEVLPKEITSLDDIEWTDVSRVYDGTTAVTFQGVIKYTADPLEDHRAELQVSMKDADVGEEKEYSLRDAILTVNDGNCIVVKGYSSEGFNKKVSITPRELYLTCAHVNGGNQISLSYGSSIEEMKKAVAKEPDLVKLYNGNGANGGDTGLLGNDTVDLPEATLNSSELLYVGTHPIICPKMGTKDDENVRGNYILRFSGQEDVCGTLNITQQQMTDEEILECIDLPAETEYIKGEYKDGKLSRIWIQGNSAEKLSLKIKNNSKADGYYDEIYIKPADLNEFTNVADNGLPFTNTSGITAIDAEIYLGNSRSAATRTTGGDGQDINNNLNHIIYVDSEAPTAEFKGLQPAGDVSTLEKILKFGKFENKTYEEEVEISDKYHDENGAGIKNYGYYIWKVKNDTEVEVDAVKGKVTDIEAEQSWVMKEIDSQEDSIRVTIPVTDKAALDNNYVVLVKTIDKVGNYSVYASNGMVVEQEKPVVQITMDSGETYYKGDAAYTLTINDKQSVNSGISEVNVEVRCNDQRVDGGLGAEGVYVDSYNYYVGENNPDGYSLDELGKGSELKIHGLVSAEKNNSNNIELLVTAKDRAGNVSETVKQEIMIDTTKPQIQVAYDNNKPVNAKYFQGFRQMIVTYTERNFNIGTAKFDLQVNNEAYFKGYTIDRINNELGKYGVSAEWMEAGNKGKKGDEIFYTDERQNHIVVTFSGIKSDGGADYCNIVPHCTDDAGNENEGFTYEDGIVAANEFSIDNSKPGIDVKYKCITTDESGKENARDITEQIKAGKTYADGNVVAEVTITEKYFAENDAFKMDPAQVEFDVTAQNAAGDIEDTNAQANQYINWMQKGDDPYIHTFTVRYDVDAEYKFGFKYTDLSGRVAEYKAKEFVVDNIDPIQKVTYEVNGKDVTDVVEAVNGDDYLYTNEEITVTVEITERNFIEGTDFLNDPDKLQQIQFKLEGKDVPTDQKILKLNEYANNSGNWERISDTDTYRLTYKINVDANYAFSFVYKDLSGRLVSYDEQTFTYDKTPPTGTIKINDSIWSQFIGTITFGIFDRFPVTAEMTSDDFTSGVESTKVYKYHPPVESRNQFKGLTKEELADVKEEEWGEDLQVRMNPNQQTVIYEKIVDKAGNITYLNSEDGVIVDNVSTDEPLITITSKEPVYGIYNSSVPFHIYVNDPVVGDTYSGLHSVYYEVRKDGEVTQSGDYDADLQPKSKREKELNRDVTVDAKLNNSNNVEIYVKAVDNSGNVSEAVLPLKIDTTKPTIQVQYDKNDPANTKYFQNSRKMTVTYTERNFDINLATFDMTINGEKFEGYTIDQINKLAGQYGVRAKWTEAGKKIGDETKLKDDRQNHVVLTFTGNKGTGGCDYVDITPHCTDRAVLTNEGVDYGDSKAARTFSIDNLDPVAIVKYYVDSKDVTAQAEAGELFANQEITAEIRVVEKNFIEGTHFSADPEQIKFNLTGTEAPDGIIDADAQAEAYTNWDADSQTLKIRFNKDANYTFSFTYTDLSGRQVNYEPRNFTYDQTAPTGTISILGSVWDSFLQTITFGFFERDSVVADITSDDVTAGVAFTGYYKYAPGEEERHQFDGLSWEELDTLGDAAWTPGYQAVISPNEQSVVYVKVVDRSGNVTYINNHDGVVEDNVSPEAPNITITMADPAYGIYNSNVPFHISVTEPTVNSSYAGLQSVYYEVRRDGAVTQSGNYDDALAPKSSRVKNLERDEVVNAELNNSNNVLIYVRATDNSGNVAEAEKELKIDITKPTIQVEYDNNAPLNDRYYNATRTATVTVTERNFDTNAVRFEITNTDGVQPSISGWSSSADAGVSDNATNTCYVTFADDGDYTLTLNCTDLAGNDSEYSQVDEFTIDKTVPTISVSYDNNSAATPGYYSAPRTATVTINEHNFNGSEVRTAITGALQGQGVQTPGVSGWSQSGDTHTATISYTADADYTFDIDYSDLAGNAAADYTQESFTIDQTKPEINIFDIVDKSANNGVVAPGVQYSDVNYTPEGVTISLQGANHGVINLNGDRTNVANGESIKMADFEHTQEMDDLYTLTAKVQDKAGNVDEKSVMFSVNRFGSVYVFSDDTKKLLDQYYTNEEQDLHVTEINVDTLEFNGISYGRDGELVNLKSGTDYTVKASGSETSWKQYQYTIKKQNFEKEGNYTVTIDSRDRATNQVNNKVKNKNIEFVIDKTKPTVVITGIENKAQYRADSRDISIAVSDNIAMDNMDIYVGGDESPSKSYTANMIMKAKGEIPFTLGSASSFQEVKAVAVDAAGNVAETSPMSVLVTSNVLVQFYSNKPVMFGSIGGIAVIAVAVYMILSKKKKNPSEKA